MIKAKVAKNIMTKGALLQLGNVPITIGQIVGFGINCAVNVGLFFLCKDMNILFFTFAIGLFVGVIKIQGMCIIKFLILGLKGVDKHPFGTKGVASDEF